MAKNWKSSDAKVNPQVAYQIRQSFLLSLIPLFCGVLLMLLLFVFAQLNLFYLEANGLILDGQVRNAYYIQVQLEFLGVLGYLAAQLLGTFVVSYVAMRWATAPFANAYRQVELAIHSPDGVKAYSRWLSESPLFDRVILNFCLRLRGEPAAEPEPFPRITFNFRFYLKFMAAAALLSLSTGWVMWIIFGTVYRRIVDLALHLVQNTKSMPHYFLAQSEILTQATVLFTCLSILAFAAIGFQVSRYMANMIFVFMRAIQEERFPISLRSTDVYHDLKEVLNDARRRIPSE